MRNKLKAVVAGTILLAASGAAFAGGNVSFGISIGGPAYYPAPVYAPPPVAYYPAPVYYAPTVAYHRPYYAPGVVVRYRGGGGHYHNHHRHHHRHR